MYEFRLPDVGEGIHEAELVEWMVAVGDTVGEGDPVAVVNTDKVSVELPAPAAGVVTALPWEPGDIVEVGQVLMALDGGRSASPTAISEPAGPTDDRLESPRDAAGGTDSSPTSSGAPSLSTLLGRPVAAPSTRKLAAELGVSLDRVSGSGPAGRILRDDVRSAATGGRRTQPVRRSDALHPGSDVVRETPSGVRAAMFRHMGESSASLATTTSTFTVRMERVEGLIADLRLAGPPDGAAVAADRAIGVLPVAAACVVRALTHHPRFNATVDAATDDLLLHRSVHLGVAVASPSGLVVPVLERAETMRVDELADEIARLAAAARDGALGPGDVRGGTFTVSSTGGLERARVTSTEPIVNLPQTALLWMSRIRDEPVVDDGAVRPGRLMSCSLSFDHRYIDGAEATAFINELTALIEHPAGVLL